MEDDNKPESTAPEETNDAQKGLLNSDEPTKSDEAPKGDDKAPEQGEPKEEKVFSIDAPEGYSETDKASLSELTAQLKPTEEQAKVLSQYAKQMQENHVAQMNENQTAWEKQLRSDKEFGADFEKNISYARLAVKNLDEDGEIMKLLGTGYGSHPAIVKLFAKLGKQMDDDNLVTGKGGGTKKQSDAEILYK